MERIENSEIVKLGFLNRLIVGVSSLSLSDNGIYIGDKFIEFPKPLQEIKYKRGLVLDKLIWGELSYKIIKNATLRSALNDLESQRLQYWGPRYKEYFNQLVDTSVKFENYLSSFNRYVRESHKNDWIERLKESKNLLLLRGEFSDLGFDESKISAAFRTFTYDPDSFVDEHNKIFIKNELNTAQNLFNSLEEHPLTEKQREACVHDEDNVLVIAGAGTGKTSTMVAKSAYLVQKGFARPEEILMLAYGDKARQELVERARKLDYLNGVVIRTFHSLGKEIIGRYEHRATDVSVLASDDAQYIKFIDNQLEKMADEPSLREALHSFFTEYQYPQPNDLEFKSHGEYLQYAKDNEMRDLAGNLVKSFEELRISNYLFRNGIRFEYERAYPHDISSPGRNVYKPDYYLTDLDVYLEHFGINEYGETRAGIDKDKYNKDREWKINVHKTNGTKLIQTFSYQSKKGLETILEKELIDYCKLNEIDFESIIKQVTTKRLFVTLKELGSYKSFSKLVAGFLTLFKSSAYGVENLPIPEASQYNKTRIHLFHLIFKWVYEQYCSVLSANKTMDFADMIRDAEKNVRSEDFHERTNSKYKFRYIMVDEFQDISPVRASLIEALRNVVSSCALFCVGDDWQAIYRFTGSDVSLTTNFSESFGKTYPVTLDKSFRFNNRIENVSSGFVQGNENQLKKNLVTQTVSNKTEVHVIQGDKEDVLRELFAQITAESSPGASVLVLSRFKAALKNVDQIKKEYRKLKINEMSAHASKGKQADYVIVLDMIDGKYGFPSKVTTDPLLESLLPAHESYVYAEERRLFYVALTRAKKTVFIHTVLGQESVFLKELKEKRFDVQFEENELSQYVSESTNCPECGTGSLIPRLSQYGLFYVCSLGKNYCDTLIPRCPSCEAAPLLRSNEGHYCASPNCNFKADSCPVCDTGYLRVKKNSKTGAKFVGCSNFKPNSLNSCDYSKAL